MTNIERATKRHRSPKRQTKQKTHHSLKTTLPSTSSTCERARERGAGPLITCDTLYKRERFAEGKKRTFSQGNSADAHVYSTTARVRSLLDAWTDSMMFESRQYDRCERAVDMIKAHAS